MALNLGGLFFTLDADTRGLINAQRRVEQFADQVRAAFRGVGKGTVDSSFANSLGRQEAAIVRVVQRINKLQQTVASANLTPRGAREAQVAMERLGMTFDNYTRKLTSGSLDSNLFARRQASMMQSMTGAERSIRGLISASSEAARPTRTLTDILSGLGSASLFVQGHFGGMSTRFFGLTGLVRELGPMIATVSATLVGLGAGFSALASHATKSGMALQILQIQFRAISGSSIIAGHDIQFIRDTAEKAGLQFDSLAESYAKFNAAATSSGLTLNQTEAVFRKISMAAGTMHLSNEKVQLSFLALEQMLSKGTVYTEELRRQLGDQLPGAMAVAANAMGVTQSKLMVMLKQGVIPATEFVPKFADALLKMWNIDPSKNIESLQASLNRLQNQWTYFGQNVAQSTNLLGILQRAVDGIANALKNMGANFSTVVGVIGAVTGAVVGLTAAWLTLQAITIATPIVAAAAAFVQLALSVRTSAEAMALLEAATVGFSAIPIVRLITIVGIVVAGAAIGFNLFKNAVTQTSEQFNAAQANIESYIKQQAAMGVQVRSVTLDLQRQTAAAVSNALALSESANARVASLSGGPDITDVATSLAHTIGGGFHGGGQVSAQDVHNQRLRDAQKAADDAGKAASRALKNFSDLQHTLELPEPKASPIDRIEKAAKNKGIDGIVNKVKDLMQAADTAEGSLRALFTAAAQGLGPADAGKQVEDLGKALEIVNNLKPKQLAAAASTLGVSNSVEAVTEALTGYIQRAREAKEISDDFLKIWTSADQARVKIQGLTTQLQALSTGFDPGKMRFLDNLTQAEEQLRDLNNKVKEGGTIGAEASQALGTIQKILADMGYSGASAAEGIALLNTQLQDTQDGIKLIEDMSTKFRDLEDTISATVQAIQGFKIDAGQLGGGGVGNLTKFAFGADIGVAFQQAIDRGKQVLDLRRQMEQLPSIFSSVDITNTSDAFLRLLRSLDTYKDHLADAQRAAERNRDAIRSWVGDGLNGLKDFLDGTKNLKDALLDVAKTLTDTAWQNFIIGPAQDWLSKLGRGVGQKAAKGVDSDFAKNAANQLTDLATAAGAAGDATKGDFLQSILGVITGQTTQQSALITSTASLMTLAGAANAASAALAAMAVGGGASDSGGLLGAILGIGSALAGAGGGTANVGGGLEAIYSGVDPILIPHGTSGPVSANQGYRINEPGIMGEYFIPRVSGYMSPNAPGGGGAPVVIDASVKYIDARGATPDAIVMLDQRMQQRDARLRKELPFLIDSRVQDSGRRGRY